VSITRRIRSNLNLKIARRGLAAVVFFAAVAPGVALADPIFINQAGGGAGGQFQPPLFPPGGSSGPSWGPPTPEMGPVGGRNVANNLTIGNFNTSLQIQTGRNDHSTVGVLGGRHTHVNVLQLGNNLQANVIVANPVPGMTFNLVQPRGSHPFTLFLAHLSNGNWFAKR
jgi:hypothetical protein